MAIVLWEIAKLEQLDRVVMDLADRYCGLPAIEKKLDFKSDPADELIAATSIVYQVPLVTRDKKMRRSKLVPFP